MIEAAREAGRKALDALGQALSHQPSRDDDAFAAATENLCRLRDLLDPAAEQRGAVNAVISAVLAGHFPLGKTPWAEVEVATATLRTLVDS